MGQAFSLPDFWHGLPRAILVSGYGRNPEPTSGLLALWCCSGVAYMSGLEWLAAVSLIGDMSETAAFPEYNVTLLVIDSDCQVHPVVAQAWRDRLKNHVVLCANTGYRPGYVHDLISFLRGYAPAGLGDDFASGHPGASGGVLTEAQWREFLDRLGFKLPEVG